MNKITTSTVLAVLFLGACQAPQPVVVAPVQEVDHSARLSQQSVDAVLWQHASAEAFQLYKQGFALAQWKLELNIMDLHEAERNADPKLLSGKPMAVIVDVDETMLDNSPYELHLLRTGTTYSPTTWKEWTAKASAKALPGAVEFARYARSMECEVFYITNRDTSEREATLKNLNDLGFPFADEEHLMLMEGSSNKTSRRASVSATHEVMLLVGDQLTDYDEVFKDRSRNNGKDLTEGMMSDLWRYFVLLPDPMYGPWRDAITGKGSAEERLERTRIFIEENGY